MFTIRYSHFTLCCLFIAGSSLYALTPGKRAAIQDLNKEIAKETISPEAARKKALNLKLSGSDLNDPIVYELMVTADKANIQDIFNPSLAKATTAKTPPAGPMASVPTKPSPQPTGTVTKVEEKPAPMPVKNKFKEVLESNIAAIESFIRKVEGKDHKVDLIWLDVSEKALITLINNINEVIDSDKTYELSSTEKDLRTSLNIKYEKALNLFREKRNQLEKTSTQPAGATTGTIGKVEEKPTPQPVAEKPAAAPTTVAEGKYEDGLRKLIEKADAALNNKNVTGTNLKKIDSIVLDISRILAESYIQKFNNQEMQLWKKLEALSTPIKTLQKSTTQYLQSADQKMLKNVQATEKKYTAIIQEIDAYLKNPKTITGKTVGEIESKAEQIKKDYELIIKIQDETVANDQYIDLAAVSKINKNIKLLMEEEQTKYNMLVQEALEGVTVKPQPVAEKPAPAAQNELLQELNAVKKEFEKLLADAQKLLSNPNQVTDKAFENILEIENKTQKNYDKLLTKLDLVKQNRQYTQEQDKTYEAIKELHGQLKNVKDQLTGAYEKNTDWAQLKKEAEHLISEFEKLAKTVISEKDKKDAFSAVETWENKYDKFVDHYKLGAEYAQQNPIVGNVRLAYNKLKTTTTTAAPQPSVTTTTPQRASATNVQFGDQPANIINNAETAIKATEGFIETLKNDLSEKSPMISQQKIKTMIDNANSEVRKAGQVYHTTKDAALKERADEAIQKLNINVTELNDLLEQKQKGIKTTTTPQPKLAPEKKYSQEEIDRYIAGLKAKGLKDYTPPHVDTLNKPLELRAQINSKLANAYSVGYEDASNKEKSLYFTVLPAYYNAKSIYTALLSKSREGDANYINALYKTVKDFKDFLANFTENGKTFATIISEFEDEVDGGKIPTTATTPVSAPTELRLASPQPSATTTTTRPTTATNPNVPAALKQLAENINGLVNAEIESLKKVFGQPATFQILKVTNKDAKISLNYPHIFGLDFSKSTDTEIKLGGFHHDYNEQVEKGGIIQFTRDRRPNTFGCYSAILTYEDRLSVPKNFFPSNWTRTEVVKKIREAYDKLKQTKKRLDGTYELLGETKEGIVIEMHVNNTGSIFTAYPKDI